MEYILCLGDSLTYGARDEYHSSYPAELSRLFWERQQKKVYCVNHGINGETSGDLLKRTFFNIKSCNQAKFVLLLIGTNDTQIDQRIDIYEDNMRQIIEVCKKEDKITIVGLLPPITGPGLLSYPQDAQKQVDAFNEVISKRMIPQNLVDFRGMSEYIIDTVHFSHEGYVKMAELWYEKMKDLI